MIVDLFTSGCVAGSDPMAYSMTLDDSKPGSRTTKSRQSSAWRAANAQDDEAQADSSAHRHPRGRSCRHRPRSRAGLRLCHHPAEPEEGEAGHGIIADPYVTP
jgi:hypothetical protein